jgi:hypothetical protein
MFRILLVSIVFALFASSAAHAHNYKLTYQENRYYDACGRAYQPRLFGKIAARCKGKVYSARVTVYVEAVAGPACPPYPRGGKGCCLANHPKIARLGRILTHTPPHCVNCNPSTGQVCACCDHNYEELCKGTLKYAFYATMLKTDVLEGW